MSLGWVEGLHGTISGQNLCCAHPTPSARAMALLPVSSASKYEEPTTASGHMTNCQSGELAGNA